MSVIVTGKNSLKQLSKIIASDFKSAKVFVITDDNTSLVCLPLFKIHIGKLSFIEIKIKAGEKHKTLNTCENIWRILIKHNADRRSLIINLGGGTVCDVGGFAASVFKRGIAFINVPTTLLAMTDAAIGGKTGVDFLHYKNMIGTFTQPNATIIYKDFLKTLPSREINSGKAEIIKHALIADKGLWNLITKDFTITDTVLKKSIALKTKIIAKDFKENNLRKLLNFGHTIGHAIESYYLQKGMDILHGEAVGAGMIVELYLSSLKNELFLSDLEQIGLFLYSHFSLRETLSYKQLEKFLIADKKNKNGKINFTLLHKIGNASIDNFCNKEEIKEGIDFYNYCNARLKNNRT